MKTLKKSALIVVLLVSGFTSRAITNTAIAVSGTNIVLSWPSYGYEIYLVQSRQTLDPSDSWSVLTNAYPANSTNRTTLTIYDVVPGPSGGNGGSFTALTAGGNSYRSMAMTTGPLAIPVDGSGATVPVVIYPPGFDFSGFTIFYPLTGESLSGSDYTISALSLDAPQRLDSGGSGSGDPPAVTTGFFRVFHIPNFPAGITNYTFDGPTFIPVDYASPDADPNYVDSTTVLINGQPTDYAQFMPYVISGVTNWGMGIYFDRFPNGTNTIQLLTTVRQSDILNDQTPYTVFSNAPAMITIGNLIMFTNWADLILSNTYTFRAQTVSNVDWEIDIYDVNGNWVNYQTGHSSDGNIAWTWNLYDYLGNFRLDDSDPFFYPYITITGNLTGLAQTNGAQPNGTSSYGEWTSAAANDFPGSGSWLFAYMDKIYDDGTTNYPGADYYYTNGIHAMESAIWVWQTIAAWDDPIKFGRTYSQAERDASWQGATNQIGLVDYLATWTVRNFYYFGHGGAESIGADFNTVDSSNYVNGSAFASPSSKSKLTSAWVAHHITSNPYSGAIPFRFVFLDGCDTAVGGWPAAWGVPKQVVSSTDWYRNPANNPTGARPNVFLGWDTEPGGKDWGYVNKAWEFRKEWMSLWANTTGKQLNYAIEDAFNVSQWVPPDHWNHLKEYGYTAMGFFELNHALDWP